MWWGPGSSPAWPSELRTPPHHATSQAARSRTQLLRHPSPKRNTLTADLATRPPPAADTWRTTRPRARGGASVAGPATLPFCSHTSSPPGPKRPPDRRAWWVRDQDLQRRDEAASASAGAATSHKDFRPPPPLRPGSAAAASARDACARYLHTGAVTAQPPLRDVEKRTFKTDRGCLRRAPSHSCLLLPVPPTPGCGDRGKGPKTPKLDLNLQSAGDFVLRDIIFQSGKDGDATGWQPTTLQTSVSDGKSEQHLSKISQARVSGNTEVKSSLHI